MVAGEFKSGIMSQLLVSAIVSVIIYVSCVQSMDQDNPWIRTIHGTRQAPHGPAVLKITLMWTILY